MRLLSNYFDLLLVLRRRPESEPHQTRHGDGGPRAHSCTSKTGPTLPPLHRWGGEITKDTHPRQISTNRCNVARVGGKTSKWLPSHLNTADCAARNCGGNKSTLGLSKPCCSSAINFAKKLTDFSKLFHKDFAVGLYL